MQAPVSTGPPSIQILPANDSGGNTRMSAARSLATSGLGSIDAGDSSEDTSDEDSMHTPVEWTTESPSPKTPVEDRPSLGKWTVEDRCNATFSKIDADNDGFLDRKEFETALKKLGMNMGPRAMTALMNKIDVNNDGEISRQEFIDFYKRANAEGADEYIDMDLWGLMKSAVEEIVRPGGASDRARLWGTTRTTTVPLMKHRGITSTQRWCRGCCMQARASTVGGRIW